MRLWAAEVAVVGLDSHQIFHAVAHGLAVGAFLVWRVIARQKREDRERCGRRVMRGDGGAGWRFVKNVTPAAVLFLGLGEPCQAAIDSALGLIGAAEFFDARAA